MGDELFNVSTLESFETVAFGCVSLAKKHEALEDGLAGQPLASGDAMIYLSWLQLIAWCSTLYRAPPTQQLLAEGLNIPVSNSAAF